MSTNNAGYARPDNLGGAGELKFIIESVVSRIQTVMLVQVLKVKSGGINPVGMVDVQPMVAQLDGDGNAVAHGVIHNIPYMRLQGGSNAIIIDPQVGDIGMCGFCSRDISSVKINKSLSTPQSKRRFDFSDGLYFGGFLNGTPTQYIMFSDGIKIYSPSKIELEAPETVITSPNVKIDGTTMQVDANTTQNGSFSQTGGGAAVFSGNISIDGEATIAVDANIGGKSFLQHTNGGLGLD